MVLQPVLRSVVVSSTASAQSFVHGLYEVCLVLLRGVGRYKFFSLNPARRRLGKLKVAGLLPPAGRTIYETFNELPENV